MSYTGGGTTESVQETAKNTDGILTKLATPLITEHYDQIVFNPPALPTTITYNLAGNPVAQLVLVYVGSDVASITKA